MAGKRQRYVRLLFLCLLLAFCSGCRITSLYSTQYNDQNFQQKGISFFIAPPKDRFTQMVYNRLSFLLDGSIQKSEIATFQLILEADYTIAGRLGIDIGDETSKDTRPLMQHIYAKASYRLQERSLPQQGKEPKFYESPLYNLQTSYIRSFDLYEDERLLEAGKKHLAEELAEEIYLSLNMVPILEGKKN